jgi:hypothetical protein
MALATVEAIRDRVYTLVEALTPPSLERDRFRRYRNEGGADFTDWADANATAALRRFQVREVGDDELPETSNGTEERVRMRLEIRIAYPHTHRYGAANAMDRDDVMSKDWGKINAALGIYGRGSFTGAHDCTPLGCVKSREQGLKVDYLVIAAQFEYVRSIA